MRIYSWNPRGELNLDGTISRKGLFNLELNSHFKFSSAFIFIIVITSCCVTIKVCWCTSDLIPASSADSYGVSSFVSPLTPDFCHHGCFLLTDGLSEPDIHIDIKTITFAPNDEIVNIRERKADVIITTMTVIVIPSCLQT